MPGSTQEFSTDVYRLHGLADGGKRVAAPMAKHINEAGKRQYENSSRRPGITGKFFRSRPACVGIALLCAMVVSALLSPIVAPYDPLEQNPAWRLQPPLWVDTKGNQHVLGTDQLGRDVLSRLIYGARISIVVMATVVPMSAVIGILLGLTAGFFGGRVDDIIMRIVDIRLAIPLILLLLAVMAILGPSLVNTILVLGLTGWSDYARFVRAETLSIKQREFLEAARATGMSEWRILTRHVLPNVMSTVIVIATLQIPHVVITEASLSFLGLGVPPPAPSWGAMLGEGRNFIWVAWWLNTVPGVAIGLTVLGGNLVGDRLRDVLDPRLAWET